MKLIRRPYLLALAAPWLLVCGCNAAPGSKARRPLDYLFDARVTQWHYPHGVTPAQAADHITSLTRSGINLLLSEGHRSLVNDWPNNSFTIGLATNDKPGDAESSIRATKTVVDACHAAGVRFMHHVTSTFCTKAYIDAHPEWAQVDARTGKPLFFEMYGGLWLLCPNNPEFRENYFRLVSDFTRRTGVDGWMVDEVEILPNWYSCGCKHCREKFTRETGYVLPTGEKSPVWENFEDPIWRAWLRFRMKSCGDFFADLKRALDATAPNQVLTGCVAGASETFLPQYWGMDAAELGRTANFPFYEAYCPDASPFYSWRRFVSEMLLYAAIARPHGTPALTLYYPTSVDEVVASWGLCNVAGNRLWATLRGEPGYKPYHDASGSLGFFAWERDNARLFGPKKEIADVALLFSKQTRDASLTSGGATMENFANTPRNELGSLDLNSCVNEWSGWSEVLVESNTPFSVIRDLDLTESGLAPYKAVVLPHVQCLSDTQIKALLAFVGRGGHIIGTGKLATRTETGELRDSTAPLAPKLAEAATHVEDNVGSRSLLGYVFAGKPYLDNRESTAVSAIRNAIGKVVPKPAWIIDAPVGVVARGYAQADGGVAVHIFNCTATTADVGTTLSAPGKLEPRYPSVSNVRVRLRSNIVPAGAKVQWNPFDGDAADLKSDRKGDYIEVTIPQLDRYGVLYLRKM